MDFFQKLEFQLKISFNGPFLFFLFGLKLLIRIRISWLKSNHRTVKRFQTFENFKAAELTHCLMFNSVSCDNHKFKLDRWSKEEKAHVCFNLSFLFWQQAICHREPKSDFFLHERTPVKFNVHWPELYPCVLWFYPLKILCLRQTPIL